MAMPALGIISNTLLEMRRLLKLWWQVKLRCNKTCAVAFAPTPTKKELFRPANIRILKNWPYWHAWPATVAGYMVRGAGGGMCHQ